MTARLKASARVGDMRHPDHFVKGSLSARTIYWSDENLTIPTTPRLIRIIRRQFPGPMHRG